jgi:Flp pilus assembly protein TadG
MTTTRKNRDRRRGVTIVETAVVLSAALFFMFGIWEWARFVGVRQVLENSAREGARYAVVHTADKTTANIQDQVMVYLAGMDQNLAGFNTTTNIQIDQVDPNTGNVTGAWNNAAFGQGIRVKISGTYTPVTPTMLFFQQVVPIMNGPVVISVQSVMYSEAN